MEKEWRAWGKAVYMLVGRGRRLQDRRWQSPFESPGRLAAWKLLECRRSESEGERGKNAGVVFMYTGQEHASVTASPTQNVTAVTQARLAY